MEEIVFLLLVVGAKSQLPMSKQNMPKNLFDMEPKPDRCTAPAEFLTRQCCVFPPFFTRDVAKDCGALFEVVSVDKVHNITAMRRHPQTLCEHWRCMLSKYDLLNPDDTLDDDKYYAHLDRWTELNPSFNDVMLRSKQYCKNAFRVYLPLRTCEFLDLHGCIRNFVNLQCPVLFPTKSCYEWAQFYNDCKEFYI